jgi:hypothetical protein
VPFGTPVTGAAGAAATGFFDPPQPAGSAPTTAIKSTST